VSTANKKNKAPVFKAIDFPAESFVLPKDGREWKKIANSRKLLFVTIAKHGDKPWPGIQSLVKRTGIKRSQIFNLLADLKEIGCLVDAKDAEGRAYHGEHGTRVRAVDLSKLLPYDEAPTGWLTIKGAKPLLIRFSKGAGVQFSQSRREDQESSSQEQESSSQEQASKSQEQESTPRVDTIEPLEELPGRTPQTPEKISERMGKLLSQVTLPEGCKPGNLMAASKKIADRNLPLDVVLAAWKIFLRDDAGVGWKAGAAHKFAWELDGWLALGEAQARKDASEAHRNSPEERAKVDAAVEEARLEHVKLWRVPSDEELEREELMGLICLESTMVPYEGETDEDRNQRLEQMARLAELRAKYPK